MDAMQVLQSVEIMATSNTLPRYDFKLTAFALGIGMVMSASGRGTAANKENATSAAANANVVGRTRFERIRFNIGISILLDFRSPPASRGVSERREDGCRRAVRSRRRVASCPGFAPPGHSPGANASAR